MPALLELWVPEVRPWLGWSGQRDGKLQSSYQVLFIFKMMTSFDVCIVRYIFFNILNNPLTFKIKFKICSYILEYLHSWKYWSLMFVIFLNSHVCGQEN